MDAALGRFAGVDPDPEHAESMTTYQYAFNNPVMFNDPLGDKGNDYYQDPENIAALGGDISVIFQGGQRKIGFGSGHWSEGIETTFNTIDYINDFLKDFYAESNDIANKSKAVDEDETVEEPVNFLAVMPIKKHLQMCMQNIEKNQRAEITYLLFLVMVM